MMEVKNIIEYLKENKKNGVGFCFMPYDVRRGEYEYYRNAIKTGVNIVKIKCEKCGKETELEFKGYKDKISGKFIVVDVESKGFIPIKDKWFCSDCKIKEMENLLANHKKLEIDLDLVIDYSLSRGFKQYEIKPEYGLPDLTVAKYLLELKNKIK